MLGNGIENDSIECPCFRESLSLRNVAGTGGRDSSAWETRVAVKGFEALRLPKGTLLHPEFLGLGLPHFRVSLKSGWESLTPTDFCTRLNFQALPAQLAGRKIEAIDARVLGLRLEIVDVNERDGRRVTRHWPTQCNIIPPPVILAHDTGLRGIFPRFMWKAGLIERRLALIKQEESD